MEIPFLGKKKTDWREPWIDDESITSRPSNPNLWWGRQPDRQTDERLVCQGVTGCGTPQLHWDQWKSKKPLSSAKVSKNVLGWTRLPTMPLPMKNDKAPPFQHLLHWITGSDKSFIAKSTEWIKLLVVKYLSNECWVRFHWLSVWVWMASKCKIKLQIKTRNGLWKAKFRVPSCRTLTECQMRTAFTENNHSFVCGPKCRVTCLVRIFWPKFGMNFEKICESNELKCNSPHEVTNPLLQAQQFPCLNLLTLVFSAWQSWHWSKLGCFFKHSQKDSFSHILSQWEGQEQIVQFCRFFGRNLVMMWGLCPKWFVDNIQRETNGPQISLKVPSSFAKSMLCLLPENPMPTNCALSTLSNRPKSTCTWILSKGWHPFQNQVGHHFVHPLCQSESPNEWTSSLSSLDC